MDLEQAFQSASRVLFGTEIGNLSEFLPYLSELVMPCHKRKSSISGKEVMVAMPFYPKNSKFISQDEMEKATFEPLNINEIKDIDSLLAAAEERIAYCGNKVFGKCEAVARIDNCVDCAYVEDSHNVWEDRYCAFLSYVRESEFMFGCNALAGCKYSMRCQEGVEYSRCFETHYSSRISDSYYAFNCTGSQEIIFGFNLRSKRYAIGNLVLPKERYSELKKKLVSEMAEKLKEKKRIFSIADVVGKSVKGAGQPVETPYSPVPLKVEDAFRKTTKILFEKEYSNSPDFADWLLRRAMVVKKIKGALGTPTYMVDGLPIVSEIPHTRIVTLQEALESSKNMVAIGDGDAPTLQTLLDYAAEHAYFTFEFVDGASEEAVDVSSVFFSTHVYRVWDTTRAKYSGFATAIVRSDYVFGGFFRALECHFCINCYDPVNLKGCFEVDSSHNCFNSYFLHNCENMDNCLFCFNVKSKRYAVCNTEVGREEFMRVKKILLDYINGELEKKKSVGIDIFDVSKRDSSRSIK
ncbi:MAG: hypothetical protein WCT31_01575 [Candidatus Micrarchaeia archaeon]|jgi:hypothetical protein